MVIASCFYLVLQLESEAKSKGERWGNVQFVQKNHWRVGAKENFESGGNFRNWRDPTHHRLKGIKG